MERENQDLALERIRVEAAEKRITVLESVMYGITIYGAMHGILICCSVIVLINITRHSIKRLCL